MHIKNADSPFPVVGVASQLEDRCALHVATEREPDRETRPEISRRKFAAVTISLKDKKGIRAVRGSPFLFSALLIGARLRRRLLHRQDRPCALDAPLHSARNFAFGARDLQLALRQIIKMNVIEGEPG